MTTCNPLLYRKRQMLAKVQSACSVLEPLGPADGKLRVEVGQDSTPEMAMNERNIAMRSLSRLENVPGAVVGKASFTSEIVGSGSLTDLPENDAYLRGCAHARVDLTNFTITPPATAVARNATVVGATSGAVGRVVIPIGEGTVRVFVEVISGTFQDAEDLDVQGGATGVCTLSSAPQAGGYEYVPISENFELLSMRSEEDGHVKHMMNAMGTFSMSAEASGIGKFEWEFTGVVDKKALQSATDAPVGGPITTGTYMYSGANVILLLRDYDGGDADLSTALFIVISGTVADDSVWVDSAGSNGFTIDGTPSKAYFGDSAMTDDIPWYDTVPPVLQDSMSKWGTFEPVFNSLSFDVGNTINPRPNANDHTGLVAGFCAERNPSGTIDPEMVLATDNDFYNDWFDGATNPLQFRFGHDVGNTVWVFVTKAQAQTLPDQDREGLASVSYEFEAKGRDDDEYAIVYV